MMGWEGTVMAVPCHQCLPNLGSVLRGGIPRGARAGSAACLESGLLVLSPRGPGWGLAVMGVRAEVFPARRREEESFWGDTVVPGPGARCWGRLLAQVVRDMTLGTWTAGSLLGTAAGSLHGFD